jgi:DNA-binding HxlR family transcriptional regulator
MLPQTYPTQDCSIARALEIVGERWTLLILRDAIFGARRFEEFQRGLGIARNVLAARLERMCHEGLLERRRYGERPERFEYHPTQAASDLRPTLFQLMKWGDHHHPSQAGPPMRAVHRACGGDADVELTCDRCGQRLHYADLDLQRRPGRTDFRADPA